jgi:hypothetical protein
VWEFVFALWWSSAYFYDQGWHAYRDWDKRRRRRHENGGSRSDEYDSLVDNDKFASSHDAYRAICWTRWAADYPW